MGEVINIGCSQAANHVLTHLYNFQEAHIPYKRDQVLRYDNKVFLSSLKLNGKTNYSPRALIYDARNGFGSLGKYDYYDLEDHTYSPSGQGIEIISTNPKVPKNEYQVGLDKGLNRSNTLTVSNTSYWSDYVKLIFRPMSLKSLESYELNDSNKVVHRLSPSMQFTAFNLGQTEFTGKEDDAIDTFRKMLEESDFFEGMQLFTESDSAWSGFTTELLVSVKDEFFNYTSNNKFNIWIWDLMKNTRLTPFENLTRIRSLVEFSTNSSLVIPLNSPVEGTNWQTGGLQSVVVNSLWELINSSPRISTMKEIESNLLGNDSNRNIVNHVSIDELKEPALDKLSLYDVGSPEKSLEFGFNNKSVHRFSTHYTVNTWDKDMFLTSKPKPDAHVYYTNNDILDITKVDTFPPVLEFSKAYTEFGIDSSIRYDLKKLIDYIRRTSTSMGLILGEKDEVLQQLHDMRRSYSDSPDFEDDSDEDYDNY
ncbi:tubulin nucleotide-binding domain-like protein [Yamadazyma tenuis ATCC 10573]|uniref:Protein DML1 n=1 Tax=Candida tenuis (strain ATCC 10573 / BCRC 21748 / CBS 615 / JCM 9827 / NBRC 10315 / NRRL Y-1498 / VKM Y-70) TaxID=590646 RepID=G3AW59_CANTC|nr:tubulin nucleotide-binding domain-like protein [Yamadazyma tenuis ATCC 10573]EGV66459.1 tubulin nucleotide-binding domain-like protein [Yamadazyma tenuis ATCC 10573]